LAETKDRIIASPQNVSVVAGAGTGKTTLLVEKMLYLIAERKLELSRIVALTFTEKAANEMRLRLSEELKTRASLPLFKTALEELPKTHIGTIHSFCAHILRLYPVEAGIDPNFQVDEGDKFKRIFRDEWAAWLDSQLGTGSPNQGPWSEILRLADLSQLTQIAYQFCQHYIPLEPLATDPLGSKLVGCLGPFISVFHQRYLGSGYINFDGLLHYTCKLLCEFTDVREELKSAFDAILIDEFQDTEPIQSHIIAYLAEQKGRAAKELKDIRLQQGKLFIVGDPKQSIYGFRGADFEAYDRMWELIRASGGRQYILSTNFRSHTKIVQTVNLLFNQIIRPQPGIQPKYTPIDAIRDPILPTQRVELHLAKGQERLSADQAREAEAEWIANFLYHNIGGFLIQDQHGVTRPITLSDIAILFRRLTPIWPYLDALKRYNIPYVVEGERLFYTTPEVTDFLNLLKAVLNPCDTLSLVGVLRSPIVGLNDKEILGLSNSGLLGYMKALPEGHPLQGVYEDLRQLHQKASTLPIQQWLDLAFERLNLLEIAASTYTGEQAVANLKKIRALATELGDELTITFDCFVKLLQERVQQIEEEGESPLSDETVDAVRIFTIHKAKGLEFPVVILADMHAEPRYQSKPLYWDINTARVGVKLGELKSRDYEVLHEWFKRRQLAEEKRILYVAMTRARETLIMLGSSGFRKNSMLGVVSEAARGKFKDHGILRSFYMYTDKPIRPKVRTQKTKEKEEYSRYSRLWRIKEKRWTKLRSEPYFLSPTAMQDEVPLAQHEAPLGIGLAIGTACHQILEVWDFKPDTLMDTIERVLSHIFTYNPQIQRTPLRQEVQKIMHSFVRSKACQIISGAMILGKEVPILLNWDGKIMQGFIDIIYRHQGRTIVADYKTEMPSDQLLKEGSIYHTQRRVYLEAVHRSLKIEGPSFQLIFLRSGEIVEL
jgi:ATP-dependent helicase/nuclease subunit A